MPDREVSRITPRFAIVLAIVLGLFYGAMWLWPPAHGAEPTTRPYSCRLLDDAERKCAFGACAGGEDVFCAPTRVYLTSAAAE